MTEEPGKRWRYTIHYSAYYNNIYNCKDYYQNGVEMKKSKEMLLVREFYYYILSLTLCGS